MPRAISGHAPALGRASRHNVSSNVVHDGRGKWAEKDRSPDSDDAWRNIRNPPVTHRRDEGLFVPAAPVTGIHARRAPFAGNMPKTMPVERHLASRAQKMELTRAGGPTLEIDGHAVADDQRTSRLTEGRGPSAAPNAGQRQPPSTRKPATGCLPRVAPEGPFARRSRGCAP